MQGGAGWNRALVLMVKGLGWKRVGGVWVCRARGAGK
jgi:hypothetical protein